MTNRPLIETYQNSFRDHFALPALTNYDDRYTLTYGTLACEISRIHRLFETLGIEKGDKIALMGKDSAQWCVVFMATITYGAVIVPILQDFSISDAYSIIRHSDAKLLFINRALFNQSPQVAEQLPEIKACFSIKSLSILYLREGIDPLPLKGLIVDDYEERFYPRGFKPANINYPNISDSEIMVLNYTSGTTGFSKGVMITGSNLAGNALYAHTLDLMYGAEQILCFLPLAHTYSCAFNLLTPLSLGTHVFILGKVPTPAILRKAFAEVRPSLIITVPLILEKIYRQAIVPALRKPHLRVLRKIPVVREVIYRNIRQKLVKLLGGQFREVIVGGAPLNSEVGHFLYRIGFPLTVGYGMTECAPLISYENHKKWVPESCGKQLKIMEIRIGAVETDEPLEAGVGEIQVRGQNVCQGYYKLPELNETLFTADGWMRTGDLGYLDAEGNLFIKGRSKTMILGPNGQNIYPEEIEDKINNLPFVEESLVLSRQERLVALVVLDEAAVQREGLTQEEAWEKVIASRNELNKRLGQYEKVTKFERQAEPFVKTPKRSIKRFLYV